MGGFIVQTPSGGTVYLSRNTTDATPAEMTVDGSGSNLSGIYPSSTKHWVIDSGETYAFFMSGVASQSGASSNCASWKLQGVAANVAGTITLSAITVDSTIQSGLAIAAPVPTADQANHSIAFTVTGIVATDIRWYAKLDYVEVVR